jgi:tetratricopeptide (TPR) repeat protein
MSKQKINSRIISENINEIIKESVILFNRKKFDEARVSFLNILEIDSINPEANYYLGLIYSKEENYPKAIIHFKCIVDMGTNFLYTQQCRMLLGYIYFKNKEFKRAEIEYTEVLKSNLKIVQVYAALAAIKYYLEEKNEAIEFAQKAYDKDPFNANVKNTYGYFLCEYDIDISKGLEILKDVVRLKPENPAYLDSLGWAYYKKGDKLQAVANLKSALDYSQNNPEILEHLKIVMKSR